LSGVNFGLMADYKVNPIFPDSGLLISLAN